MKWSTTVFALCASVGWLNAALPFWAADFSDGFPEGWSTEDAAGQGVFWAYCPQFDACLPTESPLQQFQSPSSGNGFLWLDSDGAGLLPGEGHISRLSSAAVDCSERSQVFLQFYTAIATDNEPAAAKAIVRVTTPNGSQVFQPFPMLTQADQQIAPLPALGYGAYLVTLDISPIAAGEAEVTLEWEWAANREFAWLIDDITLTASNPAAPDSAVFFEPFAGGASGWTSQVLPLSGGDSTWAWSAGGDVSLGLGAVVSDFGPYFFIHSPTAADGAMTFHADFYTTGGDTPGQEFYLCELVSPPIDLSGVTTPLALSFHQLAWLGNTAPDAPVSNEGARFINSFSFSTDGGQTWSSPEAVNPYLTSITSINRNEIPPLDSRERFPIPGAAGSSAFRIKFTWAGDFFFWALDDIALELRPDNDLRTNANFFARAPNAITPESQLMPLPLQADVQNIGAQPAHSPVQSFYLYAEPSGAPMAYLELSGLPSLEVDALFENVVFPAALSPSTFGLEGRYRGQYQIAHQEPDERPEDNTVGWSMEVSSGTFAKEFGFTRDVAPNSAFDYTYGNCFFVPEGAGFYAQHLSFGVSNAGALANNGRTVNTLLYEWQGDLNGDGFAGPEELEEIAINLYAFNGTESGEQIILPASFEGEGVPLKDNTYYLACVRYNDLTGPPLFLLASDTIDYTATLSASLGSGGVPQYASVLDVGNTGVFSLLGFGYDIVPTIRLHIGDSPIINSSRNGLAEAATLIAWPNPATKQVSIDFDGLAPQQGELIVKDALGRLVLKEKVDGIQHKPVTFDVQNWAAGYYTAAVYWHSGLATTRFLVAQP